VSGDFFDNGWKPHRCPPELTNFALKHLPRCFGIPGQHDLPYHRYADIHRSAYWTLREAGLVEDVQNDMPASIILDKGSPYPTMNLHAFPWGFPIETLREREKRLGMDFSNALNVAMIHAYIWTGDKGYEGAPDDKMVSQYEAKLEGYHVAMFGDNHKRFKLKLKGGCYVVNTGSFIRRRSDERDYIPAVAIVYTDGQVRWHLLDTTADQFLDAPRAEAKEATFDGSEFIAGLEALGDKALDFGEALRLAVTDEPEPVRKIILDALPGG